MTTNNKLYIASNHIVNINDIKGMCIVVVTIIIVMIIIVITRLRNARSVRASTGVICMLIA